MMGQADYSFPRDKYMGFGFELSIDELLSFNYSERKGYKRTNSAKQNGFFANKTVHRLFYEFYHGVILSNSDVIHHLDKDKTNFCIDNLKLMAPSEHDNIHTSHKKSRKLDKYSKIVQSVYNNPYKTKKQIAKLNNVHERTVFRACEKLGGFSAVRDKAQNCVEGC